MCLDIRHSTLNVTEILNFFIYKYDKYTEYMYRRAPKFDFDIDPVNFRTDPVHNIKKLL